MSKINSETTHMKKIIIPIVLAITLAACGNTKPEDQTNDGKVNPDTSVQKQNTDQTDVQVAGKPIKMSEDEFASKVFDFRQGGKFKYQGDKPCMIDFYADWCGPCKLIAPHMEALAGQFANEIYVYKVNTDFAQDLAMYYDINAIPAVMFCPMKGDPQIVVGANEKAEYERLINTVLLGKK